MTTDTNRPPLTPRQRAEATRKANKAKRDEARWKAEEQYKKDKARVVHAMRRVLENDAASPGLTVFAAETLNHILGVGLVPCSAQRALDGEPVDLDVFRKAVDALTGTADKD